MNLSEISKDQFESLSDEQLATILYGASQDTCEYADVALVLGGNPNHCGERAYKAAELWREGRVGFLIPSGGVEWEFDGARISESAYLASILRAEGVPEEAILPENQATTTKENMLYGTIVLNRELKIQNVKTVCIVTSASHLRRSLGLAKLFLPRSVKIVGCPASLPVDPIAVLRTAHGRYWTMRELPLLKSLIDNGLIDDIEF